ncbi:MAG: hypothetical protein HZB92_06750 [Euryarchaeota archaeon]|nr:hypothetical protein [Euryarchaeota archaeon]
MTDMPNLEIEEIAKESGSLSRTCHLRINQKDLITPTRALGITRSNTSDLDALETVIDSKFTPLGEVYAQISIDFLAKVLEDDNVGKDFSSKLSLRLCQLRDKGVIPYLSLTLTDSEGTPRNRIPSIKILQLLYNFLWGTEGNMIIVPPIFGILNNEREYLKLLTSLEQRQKANIYRNHKPIMAVIPSSYRLIAPHIIKRYWENGYRIFAFNCENKKYGAFGYIIEKLQLELNELSKNDHDEYILHALNSKLRIGRGDNSRINNLLAPGFGFDAYGPSHGGRQRWRPLDNAPPAIEMNYLFNRKTYGFHPVSEIMEHQDLFDSILDSSTLKHVKLNQLSSERPDIVKSVCSKHNLETSILEIKKFPQLIQNKKIMNHFSTKIRIQEEINQMRKLSGHRNTPTIDRWLK